MKYEIISERINSAMKNANISQKKLAARTNISTISIRGYQKGLHKPTETTARKLSEVLKVNYKWLIGEDTSNSIPGAEKTEPETIFTLGDFLSKCHMSDKEIIICQTNKAEIIFLNDELDELDAGQLKKAIFGHYIFSFSIVLGLFEYILSKDVLNSNITSLYFHNDYIILWVDY